MTTFPAASELAQLTAQKTRNDAVDVAKGIGIVLVVFGHVWRGVFNAGLLYDKALFEVIDNWIYAFHMPLFFFLAGLFIRHSAERPLINVLDTKFRSIAYPYLLWSVIQGLLHAVIVGKTSWKAELHRMPYNLFLSPTGQFWFLYVLLLCELLYLFLIRLHLPKLLMMVVAIAVFRFCHVQGNIFGNAFWQMFAYLVLGALCSGLVLKYLARKCLNWSVLAFIALAAIETFLSVKMPVDAVGPILVRAVVGIFMVLALSHAIYCLMSASLVILFGRLSLQIYLAHVIFAAGFRLMASRLAEIGSLPVHVIGGLLAGLFGPLGLWYLSQRIGLEFIYRLRAKAAQ